MKPDTPKSTIVALASGAGRAGVAVIRVSGNRVRDVLRAITREEPPTPRRAEMHIFSGFSNDEIDRGLVLFFESPNSFTGEDVVEFHAHGGAAVIASLIEECVRIDGVRIAEPGEFTRRAFENGKLDLAQAEGIADLVDAETEGQRKQAVRQMEGALSALYESWRAKLIEAAALLEASIDFPDEELPEDLAKRVGPLLDALATEMRGHLDDAHRGERVRDGYRIAIIGPPNAGKSSLLNALARREAAIVSEIPGTTRDVVEIRVVLAGYPVWIADTAGLRDAADLVEAEGVRRALERAEQADLRIGVAEAGEPAPAELLKALKPGDIVVRSKTDLRPHTPSPPGQPVGMLELPIAARTGLGVPALEKALTARVGQALDRDEAPVLTRARHRKLVQEALDGVRRGQSVLDLGAELSAEELRRATDAIGRLTGRIHVEDLLGEIFSSFCIGK